MQYYFGIHVMLNTLTIDIVKDFNQCSRILHKKIKIVVDPVVYLKTAPDQLQ